MCSVHLMHHTHTVGSRPAITVMSESQTEIRRKRAVLQQRAMALEDEQRTLDAKWYALKNDTDAMVMLCDHPDDVRSRPYGPYSSKEWNCPDCGRCS